MENRSRDPERPAVLFTSYTADWTGPTNSLLQLAEGLNQTYDVSVLLPGRGVFTDRLAEHGIRYYSFPTLTKWRLFSIVRLIREIRPAIVYANTTHSSSRVAFLATRIARVPFVAHIRGMQWQYSRKRLWYLRHAAAVIAVSKACAESVRRFVDPAQLYVVYNGVPRRVPAEDPGSVQRVSAGVPEDAILILGVGHICRRKGQALAVDALAHVARERDDVHLCLAGSLDREPDYVERLLDRTRELGLTGRVHVLGFRPDVARLTEAADVFVHSALADPHPRAVLEAMQSGLPVVAFGVDGVAETVVDGVTGRLVAAGDTVHLGRALLDLCQLPEQRVEMGKRGRERVDSLFTAEVTTRRIARIINAVLNGENPAS